MSTSSPYATHNRKKRAADPRLSVNFAAVVAQLVGHDADVRVSHVAQGGSRAVRWRYVVLKTRAVLERLHERHVVIEVGDRIDIGNIGQIERG